MNFIGEPGDGAEAEPIPGPTAELLMEKAKRHRVHIHGGSFAELNPEGGRPFNTTVMIDAHGAIVARYRKLHTFDVTLPDGTVCEESARVQPGDEIVTAKTELGRLGFAICYDIRFPELFRLLALNFQGLDTPMATFGGAISGDAGARSITIWVGKPYGEWGLTPGNKVAKLIAAGADSNGTLTNAGKIRVVAVDLIVLQILGLALPTAVSVPVFAFLGGMTTLALVLYLATGDSWFSFTSLIFFGVIVSAIQ